MDAVPNIDEFGNLLMLRQALDILVAPTDVQHGLYPSDRNASDEMRVLYRDAWSRVRPVFGPALPAAGRTSLERIDQALDEDALDWARIRAEAAAATRALPPIGGAREPRPWMDQIVRGGADLRLRLRRQCQGTGAR